MSADRIGSYVGHDEHGVEWARAVVVNSRGHEHPTLHASVRVGEGRSREEALSLARSSLCALIRAAELGLRALEGMS